jgi:hypothetical protein
MTLQFDPLETILKIDAWLDSMRQPGGYGGPVVHWWEDCLTYSGPGLDWRYEGIILGYLNLWQATGEGRWLEKALRAGDDLLAGQQPSGNYHNSCFELNPNSGGTPHEAAADLGLLRLAAVLKEGGDPAWPRYFQAAHSNLQRFYLDRLWDGAAQRFNDVPGVPSFVPNKSATLVLALLADADLSGEATHLETHIRPTLEAICDFQVQGGDLAGGITQNSLRGQRVKKIFPYYTARCIPALVLGYQRLGAEAYLEAAMAAGSFIINSRYPDGSWPQVRYPGGRVNRYPQWVAPVGDVLLALDLLQPYGLDDEREPTLDWLLAGRLPDGSFRSGVGFGRARIPPHKTDPRDEIACVGWTDKAFRYLTTLLR